MTEQQLPATRDRRAPNEPDLEVSRVMPASASNIWAAWIDPASVARWWGPHGFTTTVRELDVRDGGRLDAVMRGPDGVAYENVYLFEDVVAGGGLAFVHQGSIEHGLAASRSVVVIDELGGAHPLTRVTLRAFYASDADRRRHLEDFQAAAGAAQLLERLEVVATGG